MNSIGYLSVLLSSLVLASTSLAQPADAGAALSSSPSTAPGAGLKPPGFTFSDVSGSKKMAALTVDTVDGCALTLSVRLGKSFSLQTTGHAAEHFVASESDGDTVIVDRLVTTTGADGRVLVSMQPLTASQTELRAARIARVAARLDPAKSAADGDQKRAEYDQVSCGCCVLSCVRSDGRPFVWNFCGCGCADCSASGGSSCCNGF